MAAQTASQLCIATPRLLVVEDNDEMRELTAFILEDKGFEVFTACDGRGIVEAALALKPDVVLMDLAMPEVDGFEATRMIRSCSQLIALPVIAISAYCSGEGKEEALRAGCNECLLKPFTAECLAGIIRKYLPS